MRSLAAKDAGSEGVLELREEVMDRCISAVLGPVSSGEVEGISADSRGADVGSREVPSEGGLDDVSAR